MWTCKGHGDSVVEIDALSTLTFRGKVSARLSTSFSPQW